MPSTGPSASPSASPTLPAADEEEDGDDAAVEGADSVALLGGIGAAVVAIVVVVSCRGRWKNALGKRRSSTRPAARGGPPTQRQTARRRRNTLTALDSRAPAAPETGPSAMLGRKPTMREGDAMTAIKIIQADRAGNVDKPPRWFKIGPKKKRQKNAELDEVWPAPLDRELSISDDDWERLSQMANDQQDGGLVDMLVCAITMGLMKEPALVSTTGATMERAAITKWIEENGSDPLNTTKKLTLAHLTPNLVARAAVKDFVKKNRDRLNAPSSAGPSISGSNVPKRKKSKRGGSKRKSKSRRRSSRKKKKKKKADDVTDGGGGRPQLQRRRTRTRKGSTDLAPATGPSITSSSQPRSRFLVLSTDDAEQDAARKKSRRKSRRKSKRRLKAAADAVGAGQSARRRSSKKRKSSRGSRSSKRKKSRRRGSSKRKREVDNDDDDLD